MHVRRWIAALVATALLSPSVSQQSAAEPPTIRDQHEPTWITLITGDRVLVKTPEQVIFQPAPGSRSGGAIISRAGGRTLVIPRAVLPDLAGGRLDRALFDVTTLLAERYDDAHTKTLPVIMTYAGSARARSTTLRGTTTSRVLDSIGARAASVWKTDATSFWSSARSAHRIWLDRRVRSVIDQSVPQIGAPAAWQRGHTGRGVKVAVLDTGIDASHPDLTGKVAASANFSGAADAVDRHGHGTHVAGTIAGGGAASEGKYKGVAPDASLLNGKVLGDDGTGSQSGVIAGMEWAAAQGADVVNMSLGTAQPSDGTDPLSQALDTISRQSGTLFVVAAGNCSFPQPESIGSPGAADAALTVANLRRDGSLNESSCRGPRNGDHLLKPEIAAPGTDVVAARAVGTDIGQPVGDHYTTLTGTSMATPHVAGTAALLAQAQPDLNGDELKTRLITTADPQSGSDVTDQGAGRVDADQATDTGVTADTAELELGELPENKPVTKNITYRNPGQTPVTLNLTTAMDHDDGPAPALSTGSLVVPANGQASVTVTVTPAEGFADHSGRILATPSDGGDPIVTTVGWFVSTGLHKLTIKMANRDGTEPPAALVSISRPDGEGGAPGTFIIEGGTLTVRVPTGTYDVVASFDQVPSDTSEHAATMGAVPDLDVSTARTVTFDGRQGRRAHLTVAGQDQVRAKNRGIAYIRTGRDGLPVASLGLEAWGDIPLYAIPSPAAKIGGVEFSAGGRLELPDYAARRLGQGGEELEVLRYPQGPEFTGTRTLQVADAGTAEPAGLTDVRGKLAVIRRTAARQVGAQVLAAQQAGAAAVIAYDTATPYLPIERFEPAGATIPTMLTRRTDARRLLELAGTRTVLVRITGVAVSPYVYDLMRASEGRIPSNPSYAARQSEFARVDETFNSPGPAAKVSDMRLGFTPQHMAFGIINWPEVLAPHRRTSYVLGGGPIRWMPQLALDNLNLESEWFGTERTYRAGQRTTERWFGPVQNAGLPAGGALYRGVPLHEVVHRGPSLVVSLAPFMHHNQWELASLAGAHLMKIYLNGELVREAGYPSGGARVPPDAADYRIELDSQRDLPWWQTSTRVRSTWTFRSAGGEVEVMPMVMADLDVPAASSRNEVRVGRPTTICLGLRHQHGSPASRFTSAKVEISYDGSTWTELPLTPAGADKFRTTVTHPVDQAGKTVHLRIEATDEKGGRLTQEVTRPYVLTR